MINFSDMKLSINTDIKTIKIQDKEISVKQYLSAEDKNSILEIAMQQADQGTILNTFALDAIFHVYLVVKYTDLIFTPEDLQDLFKLYDLLESNNIINQVVAAIPETEYNTLRTYMTEMVNSYLTYRNSARALLEQFTVFAPQTAEQLQEITENFDINKLQQIISLANKTGENNNVTTIE